jgi:hypothetical protein
VFAVSYQLQRKNSEKRQNKVLGGRFSLFFYFSSWYWGLNSGLCTYTAVILAFSHYVFPYAIGLCKMA